MDEANQQRILTERATAALKAAIDEFITTEKATSAVGFVLGELPLRVVYSRVLVKVLVLKETMPASISASQPARF